MNPMEVDALQKRRNQVISELNSIGQLRVVPGTGSPADREDMLDDELQAIDRELLLYEFDGGKLS